MTRFVVYRRDERALQASAVRQGSARRDRYRVEEKSIAKKQDSSQIVLEDNPRWGRKAASRLTLDNRAFSGLVKRYLSGSDCRSMFDV